MPTMGRGLILLCLLTTTVLAQEAIDRSTQRNGMHACPAGQLMTGVHVGNNQLLCAPGKGDFAHEIVDANTVRNQMHACPVGYAMTGLHVDSNLLSCVKLIDPPQPPLVDPGTARMGMHACPAGRFMSGTVQNAAGQPAANQEVMVTAQGGRRIRAYTNARGEYRVVGLPPGPAQIQVGAQRQTVVLGPSTKGALRLK